MLYIGILHISAIHRNTALECQPNLHSHSCLPRSSSKSGGMGEKTVERGPNTAVASVATAVVCGGVAIIVWVEPENEAIHMYTTRSNKQGKATQHTHVHIIYIYIIIINTWFVANKSKELVIRWNLRTEQLPCMCSHPCVCVCVRVCV